MAIARWPWARSRYFASDKGPARTFHNVFLLRFAPDGRCAEFTEYYMKEA